MEGMEGVGGVVSGGQCDCPVPFRLVMHLSCPVLSCPVPSRHASQVRSSHPLIRFPMTKYLFMILALGSSQRRVKRESAD